MNMSKKRRIVTLCGSTRFYDEFVIANFDRTMLGEIVLSVGFYPHAQEHGENIGLSSSHDEKKRLDELHFDKILMSDEIFVLNVDGYVGESTCNEIALAVLHNKIITWLFPHYGGDEWFEANSHDIGRRIAEHVSAGRG